MARPKARHFGPAWCFACSGWHGPGSRPQPGMFTTPAPTAGPDCQQPTRPPPQPPSSRQRPSPARERPSPPAAYKATEPDAPRTLNIIPSLPRAASLGLVSRPLALVVVLRRVRPTSPIMVISIQGQHSLLPLSPISHHVRLSHPSPPLSSCSC